MLKRLLLIGAILFAVSSAAQAAMCRSTYMDYYCTIECENQFIICKSMSYYAAACQNAFDSCKASCVRCMPYLPSLQQVGQAVTEPTFGEKIFGPWASRTE